MNDSVYQNTMSDPRLSHIDEKGLPRMVDVSDKAVTARSARAEARVVFPSDVLSELRDRNWQSAKGGVWQSAIIAGTQAVKKTSDLIPFCHPLPIEGCDFDISESENGLVISCEVRTTHKTGVEMEALTGAGVAALTVIDMCKALSPALRVTDLRLREKTGGKSEVRLP
jgi:cyclic pyranopterin phosphate synthase